MLVRYILSRVVVSDSVNYLNYLSCNILTVCIQLTYFLTLIIIIKSDPLATVSGYVMKQWYPLDVFWYSHWNNLCVYFTSNAGFTDRYTWQIHYVYCTTKVLYLPFMLVNRDWKQSPLIDQIFDIEKITDQDFIMNTPFPFSNFNATLLLFSFR